MKALPKLFCMTAVTAASVLVLSGCSSVADEASDLFDLDANEFSEEPFDLDANEFSEEQCQSDEW